MKDIDKIRQHARKCEKLEKQIKEIEIAIKKQEKYLYKQIDKENKKIDDLRKEKIQKIDKLDELEEGQRKKFIVSIFFEKEKREEKEYDTIKECLDFLQKRNSFYSKNKNRIFEVQIRKNRYK